MWIVDERYWLMTSNRTLRTLIGRAVAKERRRYTSLRPDFACARLLTEGVLVELKRPAHALTLADLNQAERYLVLAERFEPTVSWRALLIGQNATDETVHTAKYRPAVTVQTFAELLADARHRYDEYLKIATHER
jgi:hypothetical protein